MAQISEHINSSNHNIHSYYQMIKMTVNLGINKYKNNNTYNFQVTLLNNSLLISIFDTPENYLSNVDRKYDMRKVRTP